MQNTVIARLSGGGQSSLSSLHRFLCHKKSAQKHIFGADFCCVKNLKL